VYFKDKFGKKQGHIKMGNISAVCINSNMLANLVLTVTNNGTQTASQWKLGQVHTTIQTRKFCK
jgi:hypothetical protein